MGKTDLQHVHLDLVDDNHPRGYHVQLKHGDRMVYPPHMDIAPTTTDEVDALRCSVVQMSSRMDHKIVHGDRRAMDLRADPASEHGVRLMIIRGVLTKLKYTGNADDGSCIMLLSNVHVWDGQHHPNQRDMRQQTNWDYVDNHIWLHSQFFMGTVDSERGEYHDEMMLVPHDRAISLGDTLMVGAQLNTYVKNLQGVMETRYGVKHWALLGKPRLQVMTGKNHKVRHVHDDVVDESWEVAWVHNHQMDVVRQVDYVDLMQSALNYPVSISGMD